jgi:phytoene dehydrogenase-like protein
MVEHDIVIVGAGHNALVVAAYLAKAGLDVGVVERRDFVGGGAQTRETTLPGFKHETDSCMHGAIQTNPLLTQDELGLKAKYGLEYLYPDVQVANLFSDGSSFCIYRDIDRTCESIAKLSPRDADAYRQFFEEAQLVLDFIGRGTFSPAPSLGPLFGMLDSSPDGREVLRSLLMSAWDVIEERFFDPRIKVAMLKIADEANSFPESKGTGIYLYFLVPMMQAHGFRIPRGGGIQLPLSLVRCLEDHGGKVYLNSEVTKIVAEGGRAVGVRLASGEVIRAKRAVVSGLHAKITFGRLLDDVPADLLRKVNRLAHSDHTTVSTNYALNEAPRYKVGGDADQAYVVELLPPMDDLRHMFDDCRYGIPPRTLAPYVCIQDHIDPSKSPPGKANIQYYQPAPYNLADGGPQKWDEIREAFEDHKLAWFRQFAVNMGPENILARDIKTPLDLERWNPNYVNGDIMGIGPHLYQYFGWRPIPELGHYQTPVEGLYLCGFGTHPGGGIIGGGRAAVQVVMEDMGIDFDDVVSGKVLSRA